MTELRHPDVTAVVLAAGRGKRMKSDLAKVLHPMARRPLLAYVLEMLTELGTGRTVVVVGHQRERVREVFAAADVEWAVQAEQRGTGHAVMIAATALESCGETLLVVCGDTPLLRASTLHDLLETHKRSQADVTVLSMRLPDPTGYGRIVRAGLDGLERIVEHRDASPGQLAIDEVNSGIYAFRYAALTRVLSLLTAHNAQGEYYLTDTVTLLRESGGRASVVCAPDHREMIGINDLEQLEEAERTYRRLRAESQGTGESNE